MECSHNNNELRYIVNSKKIKMYCFQCLDCGRTYGKWQPSPQTKEAIDGCLPVDRIFEDAGHKKQIDEWKNQREHEKREKHHKYEVYINMSSDWQLRRRLVLRRCNNLCEACLINTATQVHHENYNSLYNEIAWDLKGVCKNCHQKIHGVIFNG